MEDFLYISKSLLPISEISYECHCSEPSSKCSFVTTASKGLQLDCMNCPRFRDRDLDMNRRYMSRYLLLFYIMTDYDIR